MQQVGLVGSGFMAATHANSYQHIPDAEVTAVASLDESRDAFVEEHVPEADVYADAEEMMDAADVSVVDVCTPTPSHRPLVEAAAERGLDVFCEKPMARTLEEAAAVIDATERTGVTFMTGHVLRYFPEYAEAKRRIDAGEIGAPGTLRAERLSSPPAHGSDNWYSDKERSGGVLFDMAIHDFDFLRWVAGDVERVFTRSAEWENGLLKQHAVVLLRFEDGPIGHVEASWAYPEDTPFTTAYEFAGDEGSLEFDTREDDSLRVPGGAGEAHIPRSPLATDPYTRELDHFIACVEGGADPDITPEDAYEAIRIAVAAVESAESGEPVYLSEVGA
ncbi:Gfo/Idh/MocA family protein [Halegenticoccus soli]|uniref:Gfo/Idh/MocA family protein n=1 Tax=Halegenticoccus soli TaxID=1985678 RepID=UPI000C6CC2DD|nr:Gfo/Idh/MocA family oxidoreductase [Halegenticoccus soli]